MYLFNYFAQSCILITICRIVIQQKGTFHSDALFISDYIFLWVVFSAPTSLNINRCKKIVIFVVTPIDLRFNYSFSAFLCSRFLQ